MKMLGGCYLISLGILLVLQFSRAAKRVDVQQRMVNSLTRWRSKRSVDHISPKPEDLLALGEGEELEAEEELPTVLGKTKTKYQEMYNGVPVRGEEVVIETDSLGDYTGQIYGNVLEGIEHDLPSVIPNLSAWDALDIALANEHGPKGQVYFSLKENTKLTIIVEEFNDPETVLPRLVWEVNYLLKATDIVSRPFYIIDATTGEVLDNWQVINDFYLPRDHFNAWKDVRKLHARNAVPIALHNRESREAIVAPRILTDVRGVGGNVKSGKHIYGEDFPLLRVTKQGDWCYLENENVRIFDDRNSEDMVHKFNCSEGIVDEANGAFSPMNDAFFYSNVVHDMYMQWFDREPITGKKVQVKVHSPGTKAYWDGWSFAYFGDGNPQMHPMTMLDVISHEISHGFTQSHSGLINRGQSGAMNEAFSDMAGEAAQYFLNETHDWIFGRNVSKVNEGLRYLADPPRDNHSVDHFNNFCPGMTVHYGGGIFNKAFYILANKPGWNVKMAFEAFATANILYWKRDSTFAEGACGMKEAARDRGYDENDVIASFLAVGVDPCNTEPRGIYQMYDLRGLADQNITFTWSVKEHVRDVLIHVVNEDWRGTPNIDLYVKSKEYSLAALTEATEELINIPNPSVGIHQLNMYSHNNFSKISLMVVSNNVTLAENLTWSTYSESLHIPFEISSEDIQPNEIFVIRAQAREIGQLPPQRMALRYGQRVDLIERQYDFRANGYSMYRHKFIQITICGMTQVGSYDLAVSGQFTGADVIMYRMHILNKQS